MLPRLRHMWSVGAVMSSVVLPMLSRVGHAGKCNGWDKVNHVYRDEYEDIYGIRSTIYIGMSMRWQRGSEVY